MKIQTCFWILFILNVLICGIGRSVYGNPTGPSATQGIGSINGLGSQYVTVQQVAPKGIINWQTFNIAPGEITQFIQPNAQSIILNRIHDSNPSQIFGSLFANGSVILLNSNGVLFGKGAQVNVNGLIASSLNLTDLNFLNGNYLFEGNPLNSFVKNAGTIQTDIGGYVYLFAPNVENSGVITSPEGHITLAAGTSAYLSDRPNGAGFLVQVTAPAGESLNIGELIADGGRVSIYGKVINQSGLIQANSIREKNGTIELFAAETLNLKNGSRILAKGGDEGVSSGGNVTAISDKTTGVTHFEQGSLIDISGGQNGGDGGSAEISGARLNLGGTVIGKASTGFNGGNLLLDPYDLYFTGNDFYNFFSSGLKSYTFLADHDITVEYAGTIHDVSMFETTSSVPTLIFNAKNDIIFNFTSLGDIPGSGFKWNFYAIAGNDIIINQSSIFSYYGSVLDLTAGRDIQLISGGGLYSYLGVTGGTININAGRNLISPMVFDDTQNRYSGIRLDSGPNGEPASLKITLGGDFLGGMVDGVTMPPGFLLANGTADFKSSGGSFGSSAGYGLITLGKGTITINAQKDIYLGNVQDQGLVENDLAITDPSSQVVLTSNTGDIHLKPELAQYILSNAPSGASAANLSNIYPASFNADSILGNIYIDSGTLDFWPSLTGKITFFAAQNIKGTLSKGLTPVRVVYLDPSEITGEYSGAIIGKHPFSDPTITAGAYVILDERNVPQEIKFWADTGDIANLDFRLLNPIIRKNVTLHAGRDITNFQAQIGIPDTSVTALIEAGRDIMFANPPSANTPFSGISFVGQGEADIIAGRNMDLGTSHGIEDHVSNNVFTQFGSGYAGLVDISLGGALLMTQSKIWTYNGAAIQIHGLSGMASPVGYISRDEIGPDGKPVLDSNGNPIPEKVSVDVGTSAGTGNDLGIVTLRGGDIKIFASDIVNVNASRIATISGGNINLETINGDINAGYGSPNALVNFYFPVNYDLTNNRFIYDYVKVPGSGIFTFDKDDPDPLPPYPSYSTILATPILLKDPVLEPLAIKITKELMLGHDVSGLLAFYSSQITRKMRDDAYDVAKANFRTGWKLGDISLKAGGSIIIPPAGIRGRKLTIDAPNLNLQGGILSGDVTLVNVGQITGNTGAITGPVSIVGNGPVGTGGSVASNSGASGSMGSLSGSTGGVTTQVASASAITVSAPDSGKMLSDETEEVDQGGSQKSGSSAQSSNSRGRKRGGGKKFQLKQGVIIEVETSDENDSSPSR